MVSRNLPLDIKARTSLKAPVNSSIPALSCPSPTASVILCSIFVRELTISSMGSLANVRCRVSMGEGTVGISESGEDERKFIGVLGKKSSSTRYWPVIRLDICKRALRPRSTIRRIISCWASSERVCPFARIKLFSSILIVTGMVTLESRELATRLIWVTLPMGTPRNTTGAPMERPLTEPSK